MKTSSSRTMFAPVSLALPRSPSQMVQVCKYRRWHGDAQRRRFQWQYCKRQNHKPIFTYLFEHDRSGILGKRCSDAEPHVLQRVQHGSTHNPRWVPIVYGHGWDWPELDRKVNTTEGVNRVDCLF